MSNLKAVFVVLLLSFMSLSNAKEGLWLTDMDEAMKIAKKEGKHILMDFTGTDWCHPCAMLHEEIFEKEAFQRYAEQNFVLVTLDFPNDSTSQTEEQKAHNEKWLEKFPVDGYPTVFLTDASAQRYAETGYRTGGPEVYVKHLSQLRDNKKILDKALSLADRSQGLERARHLDTALSLENAFIEGRTALFDETVSLGKSDKVLRSKYQGIKDYMERVAELKSLEQKVARSGYLDGKKKQAAGKSISKELGALEKKANFPEGKDLMALIEAKRYLHILMDKNAEGIKIVEKYVSDDQYSIEFRQRVAATLPHLYLEVKGLDAAMKVYDSATAMAPDSDKGQSLVKYREGEIEHMKRILKINSQK